MPQLTTVPVPSHAPAPHEDSSTAVTLPDGAALVVGPTGTVLAYRHPFPLPNVGASSLRGRCVEEIEPTALGESLGRLWRSFYRDKSLHVSEVEIRAEPHKPVAHYSLSLGAVPHPAFSDYCVITVRNITRHTSEVQELLSTIQALREQCKQWEGTARTMAHDMRSSLSAMTGFLQLSLLEKESFPPAIEANLVRAFQLGQQLEGVLGDLERGRGPHDHDSERVTLKALGQRLFLTLHGAFPEVPFTWHVESADEVVRVPPRVTWSALWNGLTNAVKYRTPNRPLHLRLRAWIEDGMVQLQLRDNGRGIVRGDEEAVFEEGRRGDDVEGTGGSGLGLFSARQQLAACGGRIWIQPALDGTELRISLPLGTPDTPC